MAQDTDAELVKLLNEFLDRWPGYEGELADTLKVSKPTIGRWTSGKNLPHRGVAKSVIKYLKKSLAD